MGAKPKKNGSISYAKWGYIFIAPFFLIFAVFQLIPLGSTIYYSFFEYYRSGLKIIGPTFVGLKNYITLFATDLPKYFGNTLLLWIIGFIPQIAISLLLAAWFTDLRLKLKGQTFFKTAVVAIVRAGLPVSPGVPHELRKITPRNKLLSRPQPFFCLCFFSIQR